MQFFAIWRKRHIFAAQCKQGKEKRHEDAVSPALRLPDNPDLLF